MPIQRDRLLRVDEQLPDRLRAAPRSRARARPRSSQLRLPRFSSSSRSASRCSASSFSSQNAVEERLQLGEPLRARPVEPPCAVPSLVHETRLLQHAQVLGDRRPRDLELRRDLARRELRLPTSSRIRRRRGSAIARSAASMARYLSDHLRKCQLTSSFTSAACAMHERRLALHEREVAPAERRLLLRRHQQLPGALGELLRARPLLLVLLEGEDQLAERLQPAVAERVRRRSGGTRRSRRGRGRARGSRARPRARPCGGRGAPEQGVVRGGHAPWWQMFRSGHVSADT